MTLTIDRIESGFAVCETETGGMVNVPLAALPEVSEGDVVKVTIDRAARKERESEIADMMRGLWE